jgi:hypothetical protein
MAVAGGVKQPPPDCWRPCSATPRFRSLPPQAAFQSSVPTDLLHDLQATLGAGFRMTGELTGVKLLPPDLMGGL